MSRKERRKVKEEKEKDRSRKERKKERRPKEEGRNEGQKRKEVTKVKKE